MSEYIASRIKKPKFFRMNKVKGRDTKPRFVIGFDSEADTSSQGKPMLFQFSLPDTEEDDTVLAVVPDEPYGGFKVFMQFLEKYCTSRDYNYIIYVFNLAYELTQIFHDLPPSVRVEDEVNIEVRGTKWKVQIFNSKRQMIRFKRGDQRQISVTVLDAKAFYNTSLDKAAKMLGFGGKYEDESLDRALFTREDLTNPKFLKYAKRDAYITRKIGEFIARQHDDWNVPTTISAPHFASVVFKTHFLDDDVQSISGPIEQAGLFAYHGGKNGYYLDGPSEFGSVWFYDINSAYPEAMAELPNITHSEWRPVRRYRQGSHGVYKIAGFYKPCVYRGMQNHRGSWIMGGYVEDVWVTSYELDEMLAHDEFDIEEVEGFVLVGKKGGPLKAYVDHFYDLKKTTTGPQREWAKLLLNSLYGKFFQKQPINGVGDYDLDSGEWIVTNPQVDFDYMAGGLYNPPIAAMITGFVRAKIHRLEHKYDAIMTSTDGLFAFNPPDKEDLGSDLGKLKGVSGRLRIWRERLYIFDGNDGDRKYALHGFRGTVADLEQVPLVQGSYSYRGRQMITLKMSTREHNGEKYEPGTFANLPYTINL